VDKLARGPQIILSRTHPEFLRRLFEAEVPEVAEKIIEIRGIAREPGSRAKVSVLSNDDKIDAVGACVGIKGSRVQAIVRELGGEKIDIVPFSHDPVVFVTRALSPAKVLEAQVVEAEQKILVTVADDQLSLAIGKGGQNARLAAKLTGWKIDLISRSERERQREFEKKVRIDIEELVGAGPKLREKLIREGIETVQDLLRTPFEEILAIQGVGEKTAEKLLEEARELEAKRSRELEAEAAAAQAELTDSLLAAPSPTAAAGDALAEMPEESLVQESPADRAEVEAAIEEAEEALEPGDEPEREDLPDEERRPIVSTEAREEPPAGTAPGEAGADDLPENRPPEIS
jgi:N utilization substance protein A